LGERDEVLKADKSTFEGQHGGRQGR
jgi:hypothetical protein